MKTRSIRLDEDVYKALQSLATPFKDKPNDVLRRLLLENTTKGKKEETK